MICERIALCAERNVYLNTYVLAPEDRSGTDMRPAVLVFPGGGYTHLSPVEAEPVALAFAYAGYHAFVLEYSVAEHYSPKNVIADYLMALACLNEHKDEWRIMMDKLAVIGFSAGGHMAAVVSSLPVEIRPAAAIMGYAVLNEETSLWMHPDCPNPAALVSAQTAPSFVFTTKNDRLVPCTNSIEYAEMLRKCGVPYEFKLYESGMHGFGIGEAGYILYGIEMSEDARRWFYDVEPWLSKTLNVKIIRK